LKVTCWSDLFVDHDNLQLVDAMKTVLELLADDAQQHVGMAAWLQANIHLPTIADGTLFGHADQRLGDFLVSGIVNIAEPGRSGVLVRFYSSILLHINY